MNEERKKRLQKAVVGSLEKSELEMVKLTKFALKAALEDDGTVYRAELTAELHKHGKKGKAVGQAVSALVKSGVLSKTDEKAPINGAGQGYKIHLTE